MNLMEEAFGAIEKKAERVLILVLILLVGCFSAYQAVISFGCCQDVLRFTIPAVSFEQATMFSETIYWQETSLIEHFKTMPTSAQRYFIRHSVGCGIYCVLSLISVAASGYMLRKRSITKTY